MAFPNLLWAGCSCLSRCFSHIRFYRIVPLSTSHNLVCCSQIPKGLQNFLFPAHSENVWLILPYRGASLWHLSPVAVQLPYTFPCFSINITRLRPLWSTFSSAVSRVRHTGQSLSGPRCSSQKQQSAFNRLVVVLTCAMHTTLAINGHLYCIPRAGNACRTANADPLDKKTTLVHSENDDDTKTNRDGASNQ